MTVTDAPTAELGYAGGIAPTYGGGTLGTAFYVEGLESNVDLRFPASALVYDRMRKEDGQVGSVARAIMFPILATGRTLVGGSPQVRKFIERELGLNDDTNASAAGRQRRRRNGIVFTDHLREALLSLWFGFMPFEQTYEVGPASPGLEDPERDARLGTHLYAHLRKLAPRMPRTLSEIRVARDGGLAGIVQLPPPGAVGNASIDGILIPVEQLVMYVNEREGADWTGNSLLRSAYKHWLIKDALIRLGAQIVERNGMGIPFVSYTDQKDRGKALALAKSLRAGATSGGALSPGMSVSIVGVSGSTADELPRVQYHDEAIGRSLLAMFLNLGHDSGLGSGQTANTFVDYFLYAINAILRNIAETVTEHIIRDLVELNYGPDEPYPVLKFDDLTAEATPTAEALKALADAKLITPDEGTEADLRRRYKLPAADPSTRPAPPMPVPVVPSPTVVPDPGNVVQMPATTAATAAEREAYIDALEREAHVGPYADDDLLDRLETVTAQLAALRQGHPSA